MAQLLAPLATVTAGTWAWTNSGSQALWQQIDESQLAPDETDYAALLGGQPVGSAFEVSFGAAEDPGTHQGLKFRLHAFRAAGAGPIFLLCTLKCNGATIATETLTVLDAYSTFVRTLSQAEAALVTDYGAGALTLRVEKGAGSAALMIRVATVGLDIPDWKLRGTEAVTITASGTPKFRQRLRGTEAVTIAEDGSPEFLGLASIEVQRNRIGHSKRPTDGGDDADVLDVSGWGPTLAPIYGRPALSAMAWALNNTSPLPSHVVTERPDIPNALGSGAVVMEAVRSPLALVPGGPGALAGTFVGSHGANPANWWGDMGAWRQNEMVSVVVYEECTNPRGRLTLTWRNGATEQATCAVGYEIQAGPVLVISGPTFSGGDDTFGRLGGTATVGAQEFTRSDAKKAWRIFVRLVDPVNTNTGTSIVGIGLLQWFYYVQDNALGGFPWDEGLGAVFSDLQLESGTATTPTTSQPLERRTFGPHGFLQELAPDLPAETDVEFVGESLLTLEMDAPLELEPAPAVLVLGAPDVTLGQVDRILTPTAAALSLGAPDVALQVGGGPQTLTPTPAVLTLAVPDAFPAVGQTVGVTPAVLTLALPAPLLVHPPRVLDPEPAALVLASSALAIVQGVVLTPEPAALELTPPAPDFAGLGERVLTPTPAVLTPAAPDLVVDSTYRLTPTAPPLALELAAVTLDLPLALTPSPAPLALELAAVTLDLPQSLTPSPAVLALGVPEVDPEGGTIVAPVRLRLALPFVQVEAPFSSSLVASGEDNPRLALVASPAPP